MKKLFPLNMEIKHENLLSCQKNHLVGFYSS